MFNSVPLQMIPVGIDGNNNTWVSAPILTEDAALWATWVGAAHIFFTETHVLWSTTSHVEAPILKAATGGRK